MSKRRTRLFALFLSAVLTALVVGPVSAAGGPRVISRSPGSGATGVAASATVKVVFDRNVRGVSGRTFRLRRNDGSLVAATVAYNSRTRTATLRPSRALAPSAAYRVILTSGIRDRLGRRLTARSWWFRVGPRQPSSVATFPTRRSVDIAPTTTRTYLFDSTGYPTSSRTLTVSTPTQIDTSAVATIRGRKYAKLTTGTLNGRWIPLSTAVRVPTQEAPAARWRVLALIYRELDVEAEAANGDKSHFRTTLSAAEESTMRSAVTDFDQSVERWSAGRVAIDLDVIVASEPLRSLSPIWESFWVGPDDVEADLDRYAPTGKYDSVFVVWQPSSKTGASVPSQAWGLTLPDGDYSNGMGYTSIIVPPGDWWWGAYRGEVFLHEWLHQVIYWHQQTGIVAPDLHQPESFGYKPDALTGSWRAWYAGVMRGALPASAGYTEIAKSTWAASSPRTGLPAGVTSARVSPADVHEEPIPEPVR